MRALFTTQEGLVIANAVATAPFPPTAFGAVLWNIDPGTVPEVDVEIWAPGTVGLTAAELLGGTLHPFVIADIAIDSVDHTTDTLTEAAHGLFTGDGPVRLTSSGTLPAGLALATDYWVIKTGTNTFQLASTLANALAGVAVAFTTNGTGTHTLSDTADTERMYWHSEGLLGPASDGVVSLTVSRAWRQRKAHRPRTLAYAIVATLSALTISASVYPIQEL